MKALITLLVLVSANLAMAQESCLKKIVNSDIGKTEYLITYQAPICDSDSIPKFIVCTAEPLIAINDEGACEMETRIEIANITLPGDITVVGVQDFMPKTNGCEVPQTRYQCEEASELEHSQYAMVVLGQFNEDGSVKNTGRAPSMPKAEAEQEGSLLVEERKDTAPTEPNLVLRRPAVTVDQE